MEKKDINVSYIIRTYNEARHLPELLSLIENQISDFSYEIIVVDSGSDDATVSIAQAAGANIEAIAKSDFTFGRSLNKGIAASRGEFCVIVSAHCVPTGLSWLNGLLSPLIAQEGIAMTYGRQIGGETTKASEHQVFKAWFPADESDDNRKSEFCNNANAAIRRSLWEEFPYDEHLTGLEDLDWAKRVRAKGYEIRYVPESVVIHHHDENWSQVRNRYFREAIALKMIKPSISLSWHEAAFLIIKHTLRDFFSALSDRKSKCSLAQIMLFRFNQFVGTYRGLNKKDEVSEDLKKKFYY